MLMEVSEDEITEQPHRLHIDETIIISLILGYGAIFGKHRPEITTNPYGHNLLDYWIYLRIIDRSERRVQLSSWPIIQSRQENSCVRKIKIKR